MITLKTFFLSLTLISIVYLPTNPSAAAASSSSAQDKSQQQSSSSVPLAQWLLQHAHRPDGIYATLQPRLVASLRLSQQDDAQGEHIKKVQFNNDEKKLVAYSSKGIIETWDASSGKHISRAPNKFSTPIFSFGRDKYCSNGYLTIEDENKPNHLLQPTTPVYVSKKDMHGYKAFLPNLNTQWIAASAISSDSSRVAVVQYPSSIRLFHIPCVSPTDDQVKLLTALDFEETKRKAIAQERKAIDQEQNFPALPPLLEDSEDSMTLAKVAKRHSIPEQEAINIFKSFDPLDQKLIASHFLDSGPIK